MGQRKRLNDEDRRQWVLNDEFLYLIYRSSRQSLRAFIRANRDTIDHTANRVMQVGYNPIALNSMRMGG